MLKIYNSISNKLEVFKPIESNIVKMYVCGPTVYDDIHIGNARPVIFFDMLKNYLTHLNYDVFYVSNITDIDDRIINKASLEDLTPKEISNRYAKAFLEVIEPITTTLPNKIPYATDYIDLMINYINDLIRRKMAYETNSGVYFKIDKIADYGSISNQTVDNLRKGTRFDVRDDKENPLDFVLWKKVADKFSYISPWGEGRPGWHTECVVMIDSIFGGMIDIHGGGFDLKFPHHENERAQAIAHGDHGLSKYWMHVGRLDLNDEKMSKSLGNIIKVKDLYEDYDPAVFKLMILAHHYRQPISYNVDLITQYNKVYYRHLNSLNKKAFKLMYNNISGNLVDQQYLEQFMNQMNNDFNTPNVLAIINELVKLINDPNNDNDIKSYNTIIKIYNILGINLKLNEYNEKDIQMYNDWQKARIDKNYELADQLRDRLTKRSII